MRKEDFKRMGEVNASRNHVAKKRGRPTGSRNRLAADGVLWIEIHGKPIEFLCKVVQGEYLTAKDGSQQIASLQQRIDVACKLLNKMVPDLKTMEVTAKDGQPLIPGSAEYTEQRDTAVDLLLSKLAGITHSGGTPTTH